MNIEQAQFWEPWVWQLLVFSVGRQNLPTPDAVWAVLPTRNHHILDIFLIKSHLLAIQFPLLGGEGGVCEVNMPEIFVWAQGNVRRFTPSEQLQGWYLIKIFQTRGVSCGQFLFGIAGIKFLRYCHIPACGWSMEFRDVEIGGKKPGNVCFVYNVGIFNLD